MRTRAFFIFAAAALLPALMSIPGPRDLRLAHQVRLTPQAPPAADLSAPLILRGDGLYRRGELATGGVPLHGDSNVHDAGAVRLIDAATGEEQPAGFRVLSRWGGPEAPVRWMLVTTRADLGPQESRHLRLVPAADRRARTPPGIHATTRHGMVIVETGPLRVTVGPHRLEHVELREGHELRRVAGPGRLLLDGREWRSEGVQIEAAGLFEVVVTLSGKFPGRDGEPSPRARLRLTFTAGSPVIRAEAALGNPGRMAFDAAAEPVHFESLEFALATARPVEVAEAMGSAAPVPLRLHQDRRPVDPRREEANFRYTVTGAPADAPLGSGGKARGLLTLHTGDLPIQAALTEFRESWPSALSASPRSLDVELWPALASAESHRLDGGRRRARSFALRFGSVDPDLDRRTERPLRIVAAPAWIEHTGALGALALVPDGLPPGLEEEGSRWERLSRVRHDPEAADPHPTLGRWSLETLRERGGPYGGRESYGWLNYGDLPWACGQASGHYDWAYGSLLCYLRGGDRRAYDQGAAMARHRRDIDQYRPAAASRFAGGQLYEKGASHGDGCRPPQPSHTWLDGLALHYWLTGDPDSRAAVREALAFYTAYWEGYQARTWNGECGEARTPGWSLQGLVRIYQVTGDRAALDLAGDIVHGVLAQEAERGYVLAPNGIPGTAWPWQHGILLTGLGAYLDEAGPDPDVAALLGRIARWLAESCVTGGEESAAGRVPLAVRKCWRPDGRPLEGHTGSSIVHAAHLVDGLAHAYRATGDPCHLSAARRLFTDLANHWQAVPGEPLPPEARSPITMRPQRFPETESKVLGWLGRYGGTYLLTEKRVGSW